MRSLSSHVRLFFGAIKSEELGDPESEEERAFVFHMEAIIPAFTVDLKGVLLAPVPIFDKQQTLKAHSLLRLFKHQKTVEFVMLLKHSQERGQYRFLRAMYFSTRKAVH